MSESTRIEDIQERVHDFVKALRKADADEIAVRIEGYASGFTDPTAVRRSVASIAQQLEYFRACPQELPDLPVVHVAANRLEDVCKDALRSGVIAAARPSLRAQGRRKATIVVTTLAAGGLMFVLPLTLVMLGVDITDVTTTRKTPLLQVSQGNEGEVPLKVLVESEEPALTRGVTLYPRAHCERELGSGVSCKVVPPREWPDGPHETYEIKLPDQAYGLLLAVTDQQIIGRVGTGRVLVFASDDTPEGTYEIPMHGAFHGYMPERCGLVERVRGACQARRVGKDALHADLLAETVVVQVLPGDPAQGSREKRRKQLEAEEKKRKAEERAKLLEGAMYEIDLVLDDTRTLLRKRRYETARERIDKLTQLFSPLDALAIDGADGEALPVAVEEQRARFEEQRDELLAFEDKAFDRAFGTLTAIRNKQRGEAELLAEAAARLRISPQYMERIYAGHAEEMERRMRKAEEDRQARERAELAALEQRCGALPTNAFKEVQAYLGAMARAAKVKTQMGECLTPRLSAERCWTVSCHFTETASQGELEPDKITKHKWTFLLRDGRVVGDVPAD